MKRSKKTCQTPSTQRDRRARPTRRRFLSLAGAAGVAVAAPHIWVPRALRAQTTGFDTVKHLLYIRLSGGFRFPVAFNGDVDSQFNPFGLAGGVSSGTEWGVGKMLESAPYLSGDQGQLRRDLGMRSVPELANQIAVLPCVDHEPTAARADGNHGTGLERYYTGYVNGPVGFFTMINYGLREKLAQAAAEGNLLLPPFVLGGADMARGLGQFAAYRPPLLGGTDFEAFAFRSASLSDWQTRLVENYDLRMRDSQHPNLRDRVDAYMETRKATQAYGEILSSELLQIRNRSQEVVDGISNAELESAFGDGGSARRIRLALRLFHFGSAAVYLDQGGYDYHSAEQDQLPGRMEETNHLISALEATLKRMDHPSGGKYWDHTVVVFGSEFSRTANGSRFNSARGSDHGGDYATRWMSMPFMGGPIGPKGRMLGETQRSDLAAAGRVYSYRSVLKTLMDGLGIDHSQFFPEDQPFDDLYA